MTNHMAVLELLLVQCSLEFRKPPDPQIENLLTKHLQLREQYLKKYS